MYSRKRYDYNSTTDSIIYILLLVIAILTPLATWICFSAYEAKSYNKLTGNNVSTLDAMFLDLRIIDNPIYKDTVDGQKN